MSVNYSTTMICNLALGEMPYATIASINDNTAQAVACRLRYAQSWAELMEMGNWGFARQRVALVEVTNDRPGEWGFAYQLPIDMAVPLRLLPPADSDVAVTTELLTGQTLAFPSLSHDSPGYQYDYAGSTLYANAEDPVMEYIASTTEFTAISALFVNALALLLASKLAVPLMKDRAVKQALWQEFELAKDRALAANANRRPQSYTDNGYVSDAARARMGDGPVMIPGGFPGVLR